MFKFLRNLYLPNELANVSIKLVTLSFAALVVASATAVADRIPDTAFSGPYIYTSRDMDPIQINFVYGGDFEKPNPPIAETVSLPRAFINYVKGYSTRPTQTQAKSRAESQKVGYDELPDLVQTVAVKVSVSDPEGLPYTIAVAEWGSRGREKINKHLRYASAHAILADITYHKNVRRKPPSYFREGLIDEDKRPSKFGSLVIRNPEESSKIYFSKQDGIWRIDCASNLKRARPWHKCTYEIDLADNFFASLQFLDFRMHGGMPFARKRIKTFRKSMCRYFDCN